MILSNFAENQTQKEENSEIQKQANLMSLVNMQDKVSPSIFQLICQQIEHQDGLPHRRAWNGQLLKTSFQQIILDSGRLSYNQNKLTFLIRNQENLEQSIYKYQNPRLILRQLTNPISAALNKVSKLDNVKNKILNSDSQQFKRMKTVFGHANFREGNSTPVYNCKFDMEDKIIITGADDGIIKIWDKETLMLQASLHGHSDMIIDIQVSKCNRYMASASNDGAIIFWDLQECKILHQRNDDHAQQVNKVEFFMVPSSKQASSNYIQSFNRQSNQKSQYISRNNLYKDSQMYQSKQFQSDQEKSSVQENVGTKKKNQSQSTIQNKNIQISKEIEQTYDQFLISCSDDGSIIIYDCSSIYQDNNEFFTKNNKKQQQIFVTHKIDDSKFQNNLTDQSLQMIKELQDQVFFSSIQNQSTENSLLLNSSNQKQIKKRGRKKTKFEEFACENETDNKKNEHLGDLFYVKLRPMNYRQGTRNKHIDSYTLSTETGLLAGGTNHGEIYLWKIKFQQLREKSQQCYDWIGVFKIHKKSIHQLKFSLQGDILFTGSGDGTAKLWKTNFKCLDDTFFPDQNFYYEDRYNEIDFVEDNKDQLLHEFKINDHSYYHDDLMQQVQLKSEIKEYKSDQNQQYEYQIDAIEWSLNCNFAYCAISIKNKINEFENHINSQTLNSQQQNENKNKQKPAIVKIQVFDCNTKKILSEDIGRDCGYNKNIYNYACVMKSHPCDENIMLSCFDGGIVIIYDVRQMVIIQEIVEYGIYSIDQFVMNNQVDVDWSSDGNFIALSSFYGTLSLYSNQAHQKYKYQATRIQQFFNYDNEMHNHNIYEQLSQQPSVCGYELNPYEIQPQYVPIIGPFRHQRDSDNKFQNQILQSNEYFRKQAFAIEFSNEEEKFTTDQLNEGIRLGYFNTSIVSNQSEDSQNQNQLNNDNQNQRQVNRNQNRQQNQQRRNQQIQFQQNEIEDQSEEIKQQFNDNLLQNLNKDDALMHDFSDQELLQMDFNQDEQQFQSRRKILQRNDDLPEEIDNQSIYSNQFFNGNNQENIFKTNKKNQSDFKQNDDELEIKKRFRKRLINIQDIDDEMEDNKIKFSQQLRQNRNENSQNSDQFEFSQEESQGDYKRKLRNKKVNSKDFQKKLNKKLIDDEDSFDDRISGQEENYTMKTRSRRIQFENQSEQSQTKNRRSRRNQQDSDKQESRQRKPRKKICMPRNYNGDDDESVFNDEEMMNEDEEFSDDSNNEDDFSDCSSFTHNKRQSRSKFQKRNRRSISYNNTDNQKHKKHQIFTNKNEQNQYDSKVESMITECTFLQQEKHQRDDQFSLRGSKNKKGALFQYEGFFPKMNEKQIEQILILKQNKMSEQLQNGQHYCGFCKRKMDQSSMIGPFGTKDGKLNQEIPFSEKLRQDIQNENLYFHQQCLELNQYVFYDNQQMTWMNIRTALFHLVENKTFTCYRCIQSGATTQCYQCNRAFHGHYCNSLYMLPMDHENKKFQCILCRNQQNYQQYKINLDFQEKIKQLKGNQIDQIRKKIKKQQLLETYAYQGISNYYQPQINDDVVYFYQGHEKFYWSNNCFFFCGDIQEINSSDLPWMRYQQLQNLPEGQILCKVVNIEFKFNSLKSVNLINLYGDDSSDIVQENQVITYAELKVVDKNDEQSLSFIVSLFPSQANQFLVPYNIYKKQSNLFQKLINENMIIGKRFKTYYNQKQPNRFLNEVIVESISPIEPDRLSQSQWMTVVVSEVQQLNNTRNNRTKRGNQIQENDELQRINFWDLILDQNNQQLSNFAQKVFVPALDEFEKQRIIDAIRLFQEKNEEIMLFKERVNEDIAPDYKSYVCGEMWLDLIIERIRNNYYRSIDQMNFDIDQIIQCSIIYNDEDDDITIRAKNLTNKLKKELKNYINSYSTNKQKSSQNFQNGHQEPIQFKKQLGFDNSLNESTLKKKNKQLEYNKYLKPQFENQKNSYQRNNTQEDNFQIQVDLPDDDDEIYIPQNKQITQQANGKSSVQIIGDGDIIILDINPYSTNQNIRNENYNNEQKQNDERKKRGRPRKESSQSNINSNLFEHQNQILINPQFNDSKQDYINNFTNQQECNIPTQSIHNKRVNSNFSQKDSFKNVIMLQNDNDQIQKKKSEKEVHNPPKSINNFENSESALIDLDDKRIGLEGNYTICSDQQSDEDFGLEKKQNGFVGQKRARNQLNDSSEMCQNDINQNMNGDNESSKYELNQRRNKRQKIRNA